MDSIQYRKATPADVATLIRLRIEFHEEYWGTQPKEPTNALKESLREYFTRNLQSDTYICYIASANTIDVGIGGAVLREQPGNFKNPTGKSAYIMNMFTQPAFRRKGISSRILNLLIEDAKQKGIIMFELHATEEGEPVYIKNGFTLHTEPTYRKFEK